MNFEATKELINTLSPFMNVKSLSISTENKDWKGRPYQSDLVMLDDKNNICFEVFDNEIIIGYLTDHIHFEDYSFELEDGEPNYVERAKEFLNKLYTLSIRHYEKYKGTRLVSEKYFFVHPDCEEESITGVIVHRLMLGLNPIAKKSIQIKTWQYDKYKNTFTTTQPWKPDPNAIEVIKIADKYIEIYEKSSVYTFTIWHTDYDDYYGMYYWVPIDNGAASFFDTKEKAVEAAREILKLS